MPKIFLENLELKVLQKIYLEHYRKTMTEKEYRNQMQHLLDRIERALANVDPDQVECEVSMGAMTLVFADRSKCILSAQPSVQQLWLAMAARGMAYHFNYHESSGQWLDDKGHGVEAIQLIQDYLKEMTGLGIQI